MLAFAITLVGCTENTATLGVYPQQDAISTSTATYGILSSDLLNNVVPANSTACYLGKVIDPETDEAITATFAAQFHTFEGYTFPEKKNVIPGLDGLLCDSIEIRLFIKSTFGDKNNPMKREVWPLSRNEDKLIKESMNLYSNTDLQQFIDDSEGPLATKVFTATDYNITEGQRNAKGHSDNVRIILPRQYGESIMQKFYTDPNAFRDSYSFIRNVCSGFLFQTVGGTGTMLNLEVCTMDLFFSYKSEEFPDSTLAAYCRFAATPEVIQSTQFESSNLAGLIGNEEYTMLKTPAGICTELVLPVNEICKGHENDSITRASFTLTRINNQDEDALDDDYALGIPQNLLLVRKQNLSSFFENHQVADNQQSYSTFYYETFNCYRFDNISHLISYCWLEKKSGMQASGMTEEAWEAAHPEWNHVVLVPVSIATASNTFGEGLQVSVNHDLSLCSTKLVRGTEAKPIQMQVIYSRFAGN